MVDSELDQGQADERLEAASGCEETQDLLNRGGGATGGVVVGLPWARCGVVVVVPCALLCALAAAGGLAARATGRPAQPATLSSMLSAAGSAEATESYGNPFFAAADRLAQRMERLGPGPTPTEWEVVFSGFVNVRASNTTESEVLAQAETGAVVVGVRHGAWVELWGASGYMLTYLDNTGFANDTELLRERPQVTYSISFGGCEERGTHPISEPAVCEYAASLLEEPQDALQFDQGCQVAHGAAEAAAEGRPLAGRLLQLATGGIRTICSTMRYGGSSVRPAPTSATLTSTTPPLTPATTTLPHGALPTAERVDCEPERGWREFYMYRAQSDSDYPMENVNMADIPGVLWYLHNEVVTWCPRKYDITRVLRFKVTARPSRELFAREGKQFWNFVAFDHGMCTVPNCAEVWAEVGYDVGCQVIRGSRDLACGYEGQWFSFPGACPWAEVGGKSAECQATWPGGACGGGRGDDACTYTTEFAGEVHLDEFTGISDYVHFCGNGSLEYDRETDTGRNFDFWEGINDTAKCRLRERKLRDAFQMQDPSAPALQEVSACAIAC